MSRILRRTLLVTVLLAVLAWPVAAVAAPAQWESVDVTLHSDESRGVMLVSGQLPESATLPAQASLSVPAGSSLQWIGEILGGDPSADPELTYTKSTSGESDVYAFTLTKSRIAQVEIVTNDIATFDGTNWATALRWSSTQAVPEVRLSVLLPPGAQVAQAAEGAMVQPSNNGSSYYTKSFENVGAGDTLDLSFSYAIPATSSSAQNSGSAPGGISAVLPYLIAAFGLGLFGLAIRRKMQVGTNRATAQAVAAVDRSASLPAPAEETVVVEGDHDEADGAGEADREAPVRTRLSTRTVATMVVVGVLLVAVVALGREAAKPQLVGDTLSQTFSQGEPCTTANIALAVPADADPRDTADALFSALENVSGMNVATYNFKTSTLQAGFCESQTTEQAVRDALAPTGLLDTSAPAPSEGATGGAQ